MEIAQGYNIIDLCIALVLLIGLILGIWKGFVRSITALASVVLGVFGAMKYYPAVEPYLGKISKLDPQISMILSMVIIFILVQIVFVLLRLLLEAAVDVTKLGWLDRTFGALMGLLAATVLIVVAVQGLMIGIPEETVVKKSKLVPVANRIGTKMLEYMPQGMKQQLEKSVKEWKGSKAATKSGSDKKSAPPQAPIGTPQKKAPESAR
jgi:membrane protein required for colicin V production